MLEVIYMGDIFRTRLRVAGTRRFRHQEPQRGGPAAARGRRDGPDRLGSAGRARARPDVTQVPRQRRRPRGDGESARPSPTREYDDDENKTADPDATAMSALAAAGAGRAITVMSWGGAYTKSQVEAYHKPFAAETGIKVNMVDADNPATPIKAQVEANNVTVDVADVEIVRRGAAAATRACS